MRYLRNSVVSVIALACTALAGCSASSNMDNFVPETAGDLTGSINRPTAPTTVNEVITASQEMPPVPETEILAWAGPVPDVAPFRTEPPASLARRPDGARIDSSDNGKNSITPVSIPKPEVAAYPAVRLTPRQKYKIYSQRFRDAKPINFGPVKPRHHAVHGVDVSRWQSDIDWATLRSHGANFAYIKATDGGDHLDPMFHTNWRKAKAAGVKRGAYHFFYWCRVASQQADWFIRNVPKDPEALPPVIDVEWNSDSACKRRPSREQVLEKMQVFMDRLERHYGKRPIIYTAPDFYDDNLKGAFKDYPFWLRAVAQHPSKVYPGRKWLFWQYSGSGLSQGVNGKIDLNVFHGTTDQWQQWLKKAAS